MGESRSLSGLKFRCQLLGQRASRRSTTKNGTGESQCHSIALLTSTEHQNTATRPTKPLRPPLSHEPVNRQNVSGIVVALASRNQHETLNDAGSSNMADADADHAVGDVSGCESCRIKSTELPIWTFELL
jgi:hypothetical protein